MKNLIINFLTHILRKYNFKGKGRLIKIFFSRNPFYGVIPYKKSLIYVDTSELIGWCIYWLDGYENEINWILPYYVKKNSVCIDVGANVGSYTVLLAEASSKVIAIEPHPNFRSSLERNVAINYFDNVKILDCAVSKDTTTAILYAPNEDMNNKTATLKNVSKYIPDQNVEITVNTIPLDIICKKEKKIDFIKIDCDWFDANVILSGKTIIEKHLPVILFEDLGDYPNAWDKADDVKIEYEEAYDFLEKLGYKIYKVLDQKLVNEQRELGVIQNMLAIPDITSQ